MARSLAILGTLVASGMLFAVGCGGASDSGGGNGTGATGSGGYGNGSGTGGGGGINLGGSGNGGGSGGGGGGWTCTPGQPEPAAIDVPGNGKDDDCDGTPDNAPTGCDAAITMVEDNDAMNAARAIGLCQVSDGVSWGVISAQYVKANGAVEPINDLSHGLLPSFGPAVNTQEGSRMLGLSSGTARQPTDLGYQDVGGFDTGIMGTTPTGFPKDSPACPGVTTASDPNTFNPVALELRIKAPLNAKSFTFNFDFYTYEFPGYVCSVFNDFFVVLQSPAPTNAVDGNISFDSQGNSVSVNNGFLEVCDPAVGSGCPGGKCFDCKLGPGQLMGTGFEGMFGDSHAATGWLVTQSPVAGGAEFTLRFAIWDMSDPILDSTVLIDNFQFSADEATGSTTTPVPVPR